MHGEYRESRAGFTLVEIMVVLAIVALVSAVAIPGLAKLGAFSRDEFKRTVSEMDSLLRAAQLYSTTYNVETAVAYNMDHYSATETESAAVEPIADPLIDSLTGGPVRQIEAAAMLYKVPDGKGAFSGKFVAAPGDLGNFNPFPNGMSIALNNPEDTINHQAFYFELGASNYVSGGTDDCICSLGMNVISAELGGTDTYRFMAHVFKPSGRVSVDNYGTSSVAPCDCSGERFALYIAPAVDRPLEERLAFPETLNLVAPDGKPNLLHRKIYIHKSTARVRVPDSQ
jgi:prepilin-type N-terminal cleavage/methylation domain-containing protein